MNELLKIILSLSLSGTVLILVLILCKPFIKNKLSKRWQYYIWLIVIFRLLLPFTLETNFMGTVFQYLDNTIIQIDTSVQPKQKSSVLSQTDSTNYDKVSNQATSTDNSNYAESEKLTVFSILNLLKQNIASICLSIWFIGAVGLLIRKITIYQSFIRYIKVGRIEISDMALWEQVGNLVEKMGIKTSVGLYTNSLISSPLLIGFFRPCIMLPTTKMSNSDFQYTILHELTHYKRYDMFYKWLIQITICLHWFNPFVYLMGWEVNRICELSCDEAVIKSLDRQEQKVYGDTLLNAMDMGGRYENSLSSMTLYESKKLLKERLDAIMKFKKPTQLAIVISMILFLTLCFGAISIGAYTLPTNTVNKPSLTLDISSAAVDLQTAIDDKISAEYNSDVYHVEINDKDDNWKVTISCKTKTNTNTETIKLYIPDRNYSDINMDIDSAYFTSSIIKSGNIVGNFNTASVLLTLPKGFHGSLDATATSGYFELVSKDNFNNTNTVIIDDGNIGEVYAPKDFIKNGNIFTFTNGTQSNLIKVTRKGMGVIGIYSSDNSDSVNIPVEWKNSWQIGDNNIIDNQNKKMIDLASARIFRLNAGQGQNQSFDYSKAFTFTQGQKLQVYAEHVSDFQNHDGYTIKLIFKDSKNHVVEVPIQDSEKEEVIFENAGTYHLTIQNDEDTSLWYSLVLQ